MDFMEGNPHRQHSYGSYQEGHRESEAKPKWILLLWPFRILGMPNMGIIGTNQAKPSVGQYLPNSNAL